MPFSHTQILSKYLAFLIAYNKAPSVTPSFTSVASITGRDNENALATERSTVQPSLL